MTFQELPLVWKIVFMACICLVLIIIGWLYKQERKKSNREA